MHVAQFPFVGLDNHIARSAITSARKRRRTSKKIKAVGKKRTSTKAQRKKKKKKSYTVVKKRFKTSAKRRKIGKKVLYPIYFL